MLNTRTEIDSWRDTNRWLLLTACLGQVGLIALPFLQGEVAPLIAVLILFSVVALFGATTLALLYLCGISAVVPTQFFDDHLLLPLDFKFYEGLFVVVWAMAGLAWLLEGRLAWNRTRLDRPVLVFLMLVVASVGIGLYYGHPTSQMLRDVRFPFYYALFFVVTGFYNIRNSGVFLSLLVAASAVVGVEYLVEFVEMVNLSVSGAFFRVARIEGLMLSISVLTVAAAFLYDPLPHRRVLSALALIPIVLALVLTMGRGMWIAVGFGLFCLGALVVLDRREVEKRGGRMLILILLPIAIAGTGYLFQRVTRTGVGAVAAARLMRATNYTGDPGMVGRLLSYGITLEKIRSQPLLGGGHGATVTYLVTDQREPQMFTTGAVDNLYLTLMLRMGVVGTVAFLWIFIRGIRIACGLFRRTEDLRVRQFCAAFIAVYGAMLVYGMVDSTMIGNRLIFFHATFLGILARLDGEQGDGQPA